MFRGVMGSWVFLAGLCFDLCLPSQAQAWLGEALVSHLHKNPLPVRPIETGPIRLEDLCSVAVISVSGVTAAAPPQPAQASDAALLDLSIELDKVAEALFEFFPPRTQKMANKIYYEIEFVTDDAETVASASRFMPFPGATRRRYLPDVRISQHLVRSTLYRKLALLQEALRLSFVRVAEQFVNTFDHCDDADWLSQSDAPAAAAPAPLMIHSRLSAQLVEKILVDQIPIEYFVADLQSVTDPSAKSIYLLDATSIKRIPRTAYFTDSYFLINNPNYRASEAEKIQLWFNSVWDRAIQSP